MRRPHCFFAIRRGKPSPYYCLGIWLCVRAKGTLRFVCGAHCFCGSPFAFYVQVNSTHRPAPETKKRWGPALGLWQGLVALARAKLRKPQLKIRLHKEKQNYKSKHETSKSRCIKTKQQSQKPHAEKKQQSIIVNTANQRNKGPQSCMRRFDR